MPPHRFWWAVAGLALATVLLAPPAWQRWAAPRDGVTLAALTPATVSGLADDPRAVLSPSASVDSSPSASTRRVPGGHPKAQEIAAPGAQWAPEGANDREPDTDVVLQVHAESINALGEGLDAIERRVAGLAARLVAEEARSAALARDVAALAAKIASAPEIAPTAAPGPGAWPPRRSPEPRATVRTRRAAKPAPSAAAPCPLLAALAR